MHLNVGIYQFRDSTHRSVEMEEIASDLMS